MNARLIYTTVVTVAALASVAGCGTNASAKPESKGTPQAAGGATKGGASMMDRRNMPVVLGPADVIEAKKGTIESSIAIQGNLTPIEQIDVRARVEGNIVSVAAREGTPVRVGQVLAQFDDATMAGDQSSAAADVESAKAELTNAQWNADQSADLFKAGAIAERDLRTAQATLTAAKAKLAAAEARFKSANQVLTDTRVVSPTNGVVSVRSVESGEHVARGAVLFTVVRSSVLELEGAVPAKRADEIAAGQLVRFASDGRNFTGKVARVNPAINPASRALAFYVEVPNAKGELKANAFATGRVVGKTVPNATLVPTSSVRLNPPGGDPRPYVYAIVNGAVERRTITAGIVDDNAGMTQVVDGLQAGDKVVGGNITTIGNGMKVTIVSNDRNRGGREVPPAGAGGAPSRGGAGGASREGASPRGNAAGDSTHGAPKAGAPSKPDSAARRPSGNPTRPRPDTAK
ncbi:MAG: efflux RND transporter periplasmic adaptor subunit [Gemmatimonadaceae bacterium]